MIKRDDISIVNFIIVVCSAIFVGMIIVEFSFDFDAKLLHRFGARANYEIVNGEYHRILLSTLVHAGFLHLVSNMLMLKVAGDIIELIYGKLNFALIVLTGAVMGSAMGFAFSPDSISVGASGITFGIMGSHLALFLSNRTNYKNFIGMDFIILFVLNLFLGVLDSSIDTFAHIGGALGGFVLSYIMVKCSEKRGLALILSIAFSVFMSAGLFAYGYHNYVDSGDYAYHKTLDYFSRDMAKEGLKELTDAREQYPDNKKIEKLMNMIFMGGKNE